MSLTYEVSLINLTPDASRVADASTRRTPTTFNEADLRTLLQSFTEIDELENAVSAPEIRVKAGVESFLIRTEKKSLLLYDVVHQDRPALVLSVDETMAEIDGSASLRRNASLPQPPSPEPQPEPDLVLVKRESPFTPANKSRLMGLGTLALLLCWGIINLHPDPSISLIPPAFQPADAVESEQLLTTMRGVYMTGYLPGNHGIVIADATEVKLFELRAKGAPQIVRATATFGHIGAQTVVATDQPGGLIELSNPDTLVYCGESYQRLR
ncbi:MAG: hypothetical protein K9M98_15375 [Cephaloticoccus sp.]|nr:hypothetical protein [Cephaloticoccus sp.]MCF7761881.1 hypothetical protein [Cephaloticoccus sp.]